MHRKVKSESGRVQHVRGYLGQVCTGDMSEVNNLIILIFGSLGR